MLTEQESKVMIRSKVDLDKCVKAFEARGYVESDDFYIEKVQDVVVYFEVTKSYRVREFSNDDDLYFGFEEGGEPIDIERTHTERKTTVGYLITNDEGSVIDLTRIDRVRMAAHRCAVCGCRIVLAHENDRRVEEDGPKCFDHIGVEVVESPEAPRPKREMPRLPVIGQKVKAPEPVTAKMGVLI